MVSKFYFSIFIFLVKFCSIFGQDEMIQCRYFNWSSTIYACHLTIYNPYGLNNFTVVNGTHLSGKTNALVKYIFNDQIFVTPNIPTIICKQFQNLAFIAFGSTKIEKLDENSFSECKALSDIDLASNQISQIGENTFNRASNVQFINFHNNPIKNFPKNVFKPLTNLIQLNSMVTNLSVIHSDSFGFHLNFKYLYLNNNQIDAFDERLIDKTAVSLIDMTDNICANKLVNDTTIARESMRLALKKCFQNYENLYRGMKIFI